MMRFLQALLLGVALGSASCSWSTGLQLDPGRASIGAEIFANDSLEPDLERAMHAELTRSLINLVEAPIAAPGVADVVIRGRIETYWRRAGIRNRDNRLLESWVDISVSASLWDRTEGKIRSGPVSDRIQVGYTLERTGSEAEAARRALKNLADRIVLALLTAPPPSEEAR